MLQVATPCVNHLLRGVIGLPELQEAAARSLGELTLKDNAVSELNARVSQLQNEMLQLNAAAVEADAAADAARASHKQAVADLQREIESLMEQRQVDHSQSQSVTL
jgi:uncharacterized small protein (DUF1192 family)